MIRFPKYQLLRDLRGQRHVAFLACLTLAPVAALASTSLCADVPHSDHPKALLSNGALDALVFLPDTANGYYRSSRFDWSGVVGCVALNGHRFFGEWFQRYDPMINDAVVGPVEEFRSDAEPGYAEAKPGETFLKLGVGVLRKIDDKPYRYGFVYPIVDPGKWQVHIKKDSVTFTQTLKSGPLGYAYIYTKKLSLKGQTLTLEHELKNTGSRQIISEVYDHDFFIFDGKPTSAGYQVRLGFKPEPEAPLGDIVTLEGNNITFKEDIQHRHGAQGYLKGYSNNVSDYDITVEDTSTKVGIRQTSDSPISRFYLWSTPKTLCPEAYIHIDAAPGKTQHWKINYRFFTPSTKL